MKGLLGVLVLVPALGCTIATNPLPPEVEAVRVTGKDSDVAGCQSLGEVILEPGWYETDPTVLARGIVASRGGNVLFVKKDGAYKRTRTAYSCPAKVEPASK
jgi:hypothetical protein